ncbi:unnamed protein product [Rangifer tarandus platyrhynchus]|uniref:Uncharacterized protein n=1 Tax=Rangifer tarandus platyrhynchus TaxID=3082113 RepID=A0ABN8Z862_RANTA|nr:unnamed protein product [Rangifer tarandus platyrhynchus]
MPVPCISLHPPSLPRLPLESESQSELLFPSPGDLPDPGIEPSCPASPALQANSLLSESPEKSASWLLSFSLIQYHFIHIFLEYKDLSRDSELPMERARVPPPVGEVRSHMPLMALPKTSKKTIPIKLKSTSKL